MGTVDMGRAIPIRRPAGYTKPKTRRPNAYERGYTKLWQRASKEHLARSPLCAECERQGRVKDAKCVDHIIPHRGDMEVFWDSANWQSLCNECHAAKTARGE